MLLYLDSYKLGCTISSPKFWRNTKVWKLADSLLVLLFCHICKFVLPLLFSCFLGKCQDFSSGFFKSSYRSKPSWPGALFLLSHLNATSNSFPLNTVSFNVVFTVGRYGSKVRSPWGILLARFGPMLAKFVTFIHNRIDFASFISILSTIRCLDNVSLLHLLLSMTSFVIFHVFRISFSNNLILSR